MKLKVVAPGHRMAAWVDAAFADYARRMPREMALSLVEVKPEPRRHSSPVDRLLDAEAARIAAACKNCTTVALDEHGAAWTTRMLASKLARWRDDARDVAFVIGSADGLAASVKAGAESIVALSALTLPHALVRVIVAEQLYRATTLLSGHPYHRE